MVRGDQDDIESLKAAFKGANVIFGLTDFWTPIRDPASYGKLKPGQTINEYAFDLEVSQGINIAEAAAATEGLERYIYSTLPAVSEYGADYKNLYHVESKPAIMKHVHEKLPELTKITSEIQLSVYYEIYMWGSAKTPKKVCTSSMI